ncbi:MAG: hypothetical protein LBC56_08570 [Oscillospiraceae bacterium]|jgi:phage gp46-like protein|nr:hypothetical protein [Oscillospiraceae bacterium]
MIPKGAFALDKNLGSELHGLKYSRGSDIAEEAAVLAEKALAEIPEAAIYDVNCSFPGEGILKMDFSLSIGSGAVSQMEVIL